VNPHPDLDPGVYADQNWKNFRVEKNTRFLYKKLQHINFPASMEDFKATGEASSLPKKIARSCTLGRNLDKSLKSFLLAFHSHLYNEFLPSPPPPPQHKWFEAGL
jgi:hypothetical protein